MLRGSLCGGRYILSYGRVKKFERNFQFEINFVLELKLKSKEKGALQTNHLIVTIFEYEVYSFSF